MGPKVFNLKPAELPAPLAALQQQVNMLAFSKPPGKIGEQFGGNFAAPSLRFDDPRDAHQVAARLIALVLRAAGYSMISSV
ncbi:MAG TPA: hypothetical protein VFA60_08240 [Terriglobales bacterium]|nr:hypothetical protein [Terriglobales bacterium]